MNETHLRIGIIGCGEAGGYWHARTIQGDRAPMSPGELRRFGITVAVPQEEKTSSPEKPVLKSGREVVKRLLGKTGRQFVRRLLGREQHSVPSPVPRPQVTGIEGVQIIAASDIDRERLASFRDTYEIPHTYANYRELIARKDIDAVFVCTPPTSHAEIVIEAARHGKHIFCEKPMAMTSEECIRMISAAKEAGVVLQIGYVLRFSSEHGRIREVILNNEIGRPVFLRVIMNLRAGPPQRWVHDQRLGGGPLWEYSHGLDFVRHVFGDPDLIFGIGGRYKPENTTALDTIGVLLTFPSGDKALFTDSYALRGFGWDKIGCRRNRLQIDVMGPRGFIQFPDTDLSDKLNICVYSDPEDRVEKILWSSIWGANGYRSELEHFFERVREGKPSNVPGEEGLRTVQLLETVIRSVQTGEACKFPG